LVNQHVNEHPWNIRCLLHAWQFAPNLTNDVFADFFVSPNDVIKQKLVSILLIPETSRVDPADAINSTHDQLVQMTAHQQLCLLAEEHLDDRPNHFNDAFLDPKYLAYLWHRLRYQMQHPCEEHIVSPHYKFILLLSRGLLVDAADVAGMILLLFHLILNYLADTRVLRPAQALHYMPLKWFKVLTDLARHHVVEPKERFKRAPQIECIKF
jgi:hypothetical protein